ncbi:MFS transporter [Novosphingobium beihaiensis]|uniref:MFS transporter n=1 Tax=Novosphingobium beihaiensis TaxID=2930389 RepID=A0ABT0BN02_9SPHN|nr:MFS transporter [Novosphingobium beihaiensis]MCJ2186228.1 MFS transporter [Novosphingobium beihaiensis]
MIVRLWPLALGAFALGLDAYVLAGLLPGMAHDLAASQASVGLGVAFFTAAYAVSAPALAFLAVRLTTRKALLSGLVLFTLGNVATMLAPSLRVLLAARLLAGVGAGLYSPLAAASAAGMVESDRRGRALALVLAGLSTGTALGVPVGLLVESRFGWRWTIGMIVAIGLASMAGVARQTAFPRTPAVTWRERMAALHRPFTWATLGVTLWTAIGSLGLYTYLAETAAARAMAEDTPMLIWTWGLGGMAGALLIGPVIDRYLPAARATLILLAMLALGFALVGYAPFAGVGAGCFLWGLAGWGSVAPQQHALVSRNPGHAAALIAWNSSANYLGGAIGATAGSLMLTAHLSARWLPAGAIAAACVAIVIHAGKSTLTARNAVWRQ